MQNKSGKLQIFFSFIILIGLIAGLVWSVIFLWNWFSSLNSDLAVGMLIASSTIIVATLTLVLGRFFERVKEAEAHLRAQKIELYDDFLKEFFKLFHGEGDNKADNLVSFLQEWQRKLVLWGAPMFFLHS